MNKERPILFSTPMVQAILEGRKTQTRRIKYKCEVGDVLWVREMFAVTGIKGSEAKALVYRADFPDKLKVCTWIKWKPSIHMPSAAARIFLLVKAVRMERLQDICEVDAIKEGAEPDRCESISTCYNYNHNNGCFGCNEIYRTAFAKLWNSLNDKRGYSWESNPMVKVIEFERIENYGGKNG